MQLTAREQQGFHNPKGQYRALDVFKSYYHASSGIHAGYFNYRTWRRSIANHAIGA
ncbi:MAG: hypothetical protein P1U77_28785 [Rubripirellula sp.]|nr:hypothetical protein [Rubripirellula sp.]